MQYARALTSSTGLVRSRHSIPQRCFVCFHGRATSSLQHTVCSDSTLFGSDTHQQVGEDGHTTRGQVVCVAGHVAGVPSMSRSSHSLPRLVPSQSYGSQEWLSEPGKSATRLPISQRFPVELCYGTAVRAPEKEHMLRHVPLSYTYGTIPRHATYTRVLPSLRTVR